MVILPVVPVQNVVERVERGPEVVALDALGVVVGNFAFLDNIKAEGSGHLLEDAAHTLFGLLLRLCHSVIGQRVVLVAVLADAAHGKAGDFAFLDFLENIRVVHLDSHHPCALLDGLLSDAHIARCDIALDDGRLFERLERVLHIHLIAVLGEPVRGLCDFLLRHVIAVGVLCEGLIDNAGDVVAISIRVDDSAVRSKRGGAVLRLGDKKLFLVGRLVYKADKRNLCICDGVCFLDFAHGFLTSSLRP